MPRAYYRPFTVYEEAIGFRNIKGLSTCIFGLMVSGLAVKVYMAVNFSDIGRGGTAMTDHQAQLMASRTQLLNDVQSREAMKASLRSKLPPA
jgi:hypothetical protein